MLPPNPPPQDSASPGGIEFKPWPLLDFLVSLSTVALLFVIQHFLPKGMMPYSALLGVSMGAMTMSYLSYCGYSVWASPLKTKLVLVLVFFCVTMTFGVASGLMLLDAA